MALTTDQNELLVRVVKAPMGQFMRENYWFPAIHSAELIPDGAPVSVVLLGDKYVAFRSTDGRAGFFAEGCPHRAASLLLARNEDNALTCIFHGWKFGVDGTVVDAPTQPVNKEAFCKKVPLRHYPVHEVAGVLWVWIGTTAAQPFPEFPFSKLNEPNVAAIRQRLNFNWLQALEGQLDSAHVSILHADWLAKLPANPILARASENTAPLYEFADRPGGFRYAAIRMLNDKESYIRVTEFSLPWNCYIPNEVGHLMMPVPIDDEHTMLWIIRYDRDKPLEYSAMYTAPPGSGVWPPYLPAGREERWGQDREVMKRGSFTGLEKHLLHEDWAVAESQGAIADRSHEFLNVGDQAVIRARSMLLRAVTGVTSGALKAEREAVPYATQGAMSFVINNDESWRTRAFGANADSAVAVG
jgi:phenylpropionate dioxygenase-like ring-hydroxylating dioxygenase large terminal subunit